MIHFYNLFFYYLLLSTALFVAYLLIAYFRSAQRSQRDAQQACASGRSTMRLAIIQGALKRQGLSRVDERGYSSVCSFQMESLTGLFSQPPRRVPCSISKVLLRKYPLITVLILFKRLEFWYLFNGISCCKESMFLWNTLFYCILQIFFQISKTSVHSLKYPREQIEFN